MRTLFSSDAKQWLHDRPVILIPLGLLFIGAFYATTFAFFWLVWFVLNLVPAAQERSLWQAYGAGAGMGCAYAFGVLPLQQKLWSRLAEWTNV